MAASIQQQIHQLEEFGGLQRRFTSDVSHELRTPLTTVRMAAEVLHEHAADGGDAIARRSAQLLVDELDRFESLLGDLLEISRLDAGDGRARRRAGRRARRGAARRRDRAPPRRRDRHPAAARPHRGGRSPRSTRAASSASCATCSPTRSTTARAAPIEVRVAADDHAVAVVVRDHGVGLKPGEAGLVFNRFWRADPSRQRRSGGTGLGLAISLEDARLHGGWLQAWGETDQGAVFRLTLPRTAGELLAHQPAAADPRGGRARPSPSPASTTPRPPRARRCRRPRRGSSRWSSPRPTPPRSCGDPPASAAGAAARRAGARRAAAHRLRHRAAARPTSASCAASATRPSPPPRPARPAAPARSRSSAAGSWPRAPPPSGTAPPARSSPPPRPARGTTARPRPSSPTASTPCSRGGSGQTGQASVRIRADKLGTVRPDGAFVAAPGVVDLVVGLTQDNGTWRISSLPAGTIVRRSDLRANTRPVRIWFLAAVGGAPVGETRYLPTSPARSVPSRVLDELFSGPSDDLPRRGPVRPARRGAAQHRGGDDGRGRHHRRPHPHRAGRGDRPRAPHRDRPAGGAHARGGRDRPGGAHRRRRPAGRRPPRAGGVRRPRGPAPPRSATARTSPATARARPRPRRPRSSSPAGGC